MKIEQKINNCKDLKAEEPLFANDSDVKPYSKAKPDNDAAIQFLQKWSPDGNWTLTRISVDKKQIKTMTFNSSTKDQCREWLDKYNGEQNLYFSLNPTGCHNKKSGKRDINELGWLYVDLDAPETDDLETELVSLYSRLTYKLPDGVPKPSVIWKSGGGWWAAWKLKEPRKTGVEMLGSDPGVDVEITSRIEDLERYNIWLEDKLGADNCHNIDRIARLPGSVNLPDDKKIRKGREIAVAELVYFGPESYTLSDFQQAEPKVKTSPVFAGLANESNLQSQAINIEIDRGAARHVELEELPPSVSEAVRGMIKTGQHPDGKGRSETVFGVVCALLKARTDPQAIYSILLDAQYPISAHVREQRNRGSYAIRQIRKAWAKISDFQCKDGKPVSNRHNTRLAISKLGVSVQRNEMNGRNEVFGLEKFDLGPYWDDDADRRVRMLIEDRFGITVKRQMFDDTVLDDAFTDKHHPVRDFLDGLEWDGKPRLDAFLIDCAGAKDTEYVRAVWRIFMVAAVRRVRQPGCKFDELVILEGEQGGNKSTALKRLAVNPEWFSDNLPLTGDSKVAIEQTQGKWIIECAELKGKGRGDNSDTLKNFLSMDTDRARMAYGRHPEEVARQWVGIGTTNKSQYLHDPTGNRRFWPIEVDKFDLEKMSPEYIRQLWAEASHLEAQGEVIRLDPALYQAAADEQKERVEDDPWWDSVVSLVSDDNSPCKVASETVWKILGLIEIKDRTQKHNVRLGALMRQLGFKAARFNISGSKKSGYARGLEDGIGLKDLPLIDSPIASRQSDILF